MLTGINGLPIITYLLIILILVKPMGWYMAYVYEGKLTQKLGWLFEHPFYKLCGINVNDSMNWKQYLSAMLIFSALGVLMVYMLLRLQATLPLNPQQLSTIPADLAWNAAVSYVTNTNWQAYSGETTMSYLSQMLALTSQNFLSAATGMSILVAFIRGISQRGGKHLGNFWIDTWRGIIYILLPLAIILSLALVSQGVIQTLKPNQTIALLQPFNHGGPKTLIQQQVIPMGPVASQVAIKQLGANGGGFFNTNSAHPFENPTPLTNLLEMLAIMLIPAAFCYTFGIMVRDTRQGWAILAAMMLLLAPFAVATVILEQQGNPAFSQNIDQSSHNDSTAGGNMEGKETRFGIVSSALWATVTTATANGSVNAMLDSFTPLGGLVPLWMMHLGEIVFGGVGSGLYGLLIFILITVFVAGLMVGRTPEYLGKKIELFEVKMASIIVLIMPLTVLLATGLATIIPAGVSSISNPGPHGFTQILYAFTSMGNNNGSAFAGLNANTPFYNVLGGFMMLVGRFWTAIPLLAIAGTLVKKKTIPKSSGTLSTHTSLFMILLISITILLGALSFIPALALGPIAEQLTLWSHYGH